MPILLYGLLQGVPDKEVLKDWPNIMPRLLEQSGIESKAAAQAVDGVRDRWIHSDLGRLAQPASLLPPAYWIRIRKAMEAGVKPMIISTKEGRFIRQLLAREGLQFPETDILG